jgi:hypothetical protein
MTPSKWQLLPQQDDEIIIILQEGSITKEDANKNKESPRSK